MDGSLNEAKLFFTYILNFKFGSVPRVDSFFKISILIYLKTIKKDLHSKQELLEALNQRVSQSLNERKNASVRNVTEGVRRLNAQKAQLITLLPEKEEQLKYALNRWVDFQKTYTEIKNINDWFEQREETLNRYQRIVTQREFEIALEDVKVRICRSKGLFLGVFSAALLVLDHPTLWKAIDDFFTQFSKEIAVS